MIEGEKNDNEKEIYNINGSSSFTANAGGIRVAFSRPYTGAVYRCHQNGGAHGFQGR
jgi:hypothetical protein